MQCTVYIYIGMLFILSVRLFEMANLCVVVSVLWFEQSDRLEQQRHVRVRQQH